jgi:aryl-alcohol dehydrogenase-like predicted oxidoreductase
MAQEFGLATMPWSPLAGGLLTGKYGRDMLAEADRAATVSDRATSEDGQARDRLSGANPYGGMLFTEQNFGIVDTVRDVAGELGASMAQVALSWVLSRPGMSSLLIGASRAQQVMDNMATLEVRLSPEHSARLNAVSAPPALNPYFIF